MAIAISNLVCGTRVAPTPRKTQERKEKVYQLLASQDILNKIVSFLPAPTHDQNLTCKAFAVAFRSVWLINAPDPNAVTLKDLRTVLKIVFWKKDHCSARDRSPTVQIPYTVVTLEWRPEPLPYLKELLDKESYLSGCSNLYREMEMVCSNPSLLAWMMNQGTPQDVYDKVHDIFSRIFHRLATVGPWDGDLFPPIFLQEVHRQREKDFSERRRELLEVARQQYDKCLKILCQNPRFQDHKGSWCAKPSCYDGCLE